MQARVKARARTFAAREATPAGRMANARSLSPTGATALQIARLAFDAPERARLFRHRQTTLRQWARRLLPPALSPVLAAAPVAKPSTGDRVAQLRAHDQDTLRQLQALRDSQAEQRRAEQAGRADLQRSAAAAWRAAAIRASAEGFIRKWAGYAVAHWQAGQDRIANDNDPAPAPTRPVPRPV